MNDKYKTQEQLARDLEEMRLKVHEIEKCRAEFREVQQKYDKLISSAPDALIFVNTAGKIVRVNTQFERMFGYNEDEIMNMRLDMLIPERFRGKHSAHVAGFFSSPRSHPMGTDFEIYALKKNGDEFPVDITLSPLHTDQELFITAAIRDITRRKNAEEQIERNYYIQKVINSILKISLEQLTINEQFNQILEHILSIPYLSLSSKGAIYLAENNGAGPLVMKAQRGFSDEESLPCRTIPFGQCLCGKAALEGKIVHSDQLDKQHLIHNEGEFPHGHYCVPIESGGHAIGLINVYLKEGHKRNTVEEEFLTSVANTLASIIKHDRIDRDRRRLQDELAQAEKLAALGRFTANVAHEIRHPLTAIGGFARRLERVIPNGEKEKEYAHFVITEVTRLEGILKNILSFVRESALHRQDAYLHEIIESVLKLYEDICRERNISVLTEFTDKTMISVDRAYVHEAVENILMNAIDSMPEGGAMNIVTGLKMINGKTFIYADIKDTGTGIPDEELEIIFEPFYTKKIVQKGTGLGLSITKKIVEEHGGIIDVQSIVGKGSTFTISFPAKPN